MEAYEDILYCQHYILRQHPQMTIYRRAAQFAPFAALTGFDEEIEETARLTDKRLELTEDELEALNKALVWLAAHETERPAVKLTYFKPDTLKDGGAYVTYQGHFRFFDEAEGKLKFTDGTTIAIPDICSIHMKRDSHEVPFPVLPEHGKDC